MPNCVHHTLQITFTTHSAVEYLIFLLEQCTCPSWLSSHQNGSNSRYKQKSGQYCCRVPSTRPGQGRSQTGVRHGSSTQAQGLLRCGLPELHLFVVVGSESDIAENALAWRTNALPAWIKQVFDMAFGATTRFQHESPVRFPFFGLKARPDIQYIHLTIVTILRLSELL